MTDITLYNTATRSKVTLEPLDPTNVRMYVCGPTVYDRAHIGNARPVIVFDTLFRLLRHVYGEDHVTYVRNFTDVDDKINDTAFQRREAGASGTLEELISERTNETINWYHEDMDAIGALRPSHEPRATKYIEQMKSMIGQLVRDKYAYVVPATIGHNSQAQYVYLDSERVPSHAFLSVDAFENGEYGQLSGRSVDDMIAGSKSDKGEGKRNPMDSVLWKPSTIEQPGWESDWGFGRPGWHIECSAMSRELLGRQFDIHGGGLDLLFPHHENELAQCIACDGPNASAQIWMHNEMLQVEGKKMSKSLGNFFTVRDLLDQGVPGQVIRWVMLSTHYRQPMNWTQEKARAAEEFLRGLEGLRQTHEPSEEPRAKFVEALCNDLNVPGAITEMYDMRNRGDFEGLLNAAEFLNVLGDGYPSLIRTSEMSLAEVHLVRQQKRLSDARAEAMETKDFSGLDELRAQLIDAGIEVRMSGSGIELVPGMDLDLAKLEALK